MFSSTANKNNCCNPILVFQYIPIHSRDAQSYEGDRINAH